jgi:hypothetical protein
MLYSIVSCHALRQRRAAMLALSSRWRCASVVARCSSAPHCAIPTRAVLLPRRLVSCRPFALMTCGCLRRQSPRLRPHPRQHPRLRPRQTRLLRSFNSGLRGRRDSGTRQHARHSPARLLVEVALRVGVLRTLGTICTVGMLLPYVPVGDADVCGCNGRAS